MADDFLLSNDAVAEFSGVFEEATIYIPHLITILTLRESGYLRTMLPPNFLSIRVQPQPPPLDVAIEVPRFLLPNLWQIALVRLSVSRPVAQLDLKVSGLTYKPAALRLNNSVARDAQSRLSFANVAAGDYEIHLPIKPRISGSLRIEALTGGPSVVRELPFTVSDFLEMRLVCRVCSRVAQLSARVTSAVAMEVSEVAFSGADNEEVASRAIGLPMTVGQTDGSALFLLEAIPESAHISVQQSGLRPFTLVLKVERLADAPEAEESPAPTAPLSTIVPVSFAV